MKNLLPPSHMKVLRAVVAGKLVDEKQDWHVLVDLERGGFLNLDRDSEGKLVFILTEVGRTLGAPIQSTRPTQADRQRFIEEHGLQWGTNVERDGFAATYIGTTEQSMAKIRFEAGPRKGRTKTVCPTSLRVKNQSAHAHCRNKERGCPEDLDYGCNCRCIPCTALNDAEE